MKCKEKGCPGHVDLEGFWGTNDQFNYPCRVCRRLHCEDGSLVNWDGKKAFLKNGEIVFEDEQAQTVPA